MAQLSGVALIDKPVGPTSHDVVAAIRQAVGQRRVGHVGTLDPLASGLLIVCIGSATRLAEYLVGHDKAYLVEVCLGVETETQDAEGKVTSRWWGALPSDERVEAAVRSFVGEGWQEPPTYSAVKVDGQPLYRLARRGRPGSVPRRRVRIDALGWSRLSENRILLEVTCSAGTYVRALVRDLGRSLGCGAYVSSLRRVRSGPFTVDEAVDLDEAVSRLAAGDVGWLLDPLQALPELPQVRFDGGAVRRLTLGQRVEGPMPMASGTHLATDERGMLVAVVDWDRDLRLWKPKKVLSQE